MAKIMTKIILVCVECLYSKEREASTYTYRTCKQTGDNITEEVARTGFPESCPLPDSD